MSKHNIQPGDKHIGNSQVEHTAGPDEFAHDLSKELNKRVDRLSDQSIDLAIRAKEAREFLDWHTNSVRASWMDWMQESGKVLEEIRQGRVAIEFESKRLMAECADVRKFFLSADHDKEVAKLREFIELMERLQALKRDGTLDKFADTILKLA